jgi:pyruvate/2-oxoglutarate dehydrogenase complex dihydrolipoamide dehydrogenase (E3) component
MCQSTWSFSGAATSVLEFAQMFRRFGSNVTVVQRNDAASSQ